MKTSPRKRKINQPKYKEEIWVKFTEVEISEAVENSSEKYAQTISSSINASHPDLVVTGLTISKFSVLDNQSFCCNVRWA